ncbi:MAG TPA: hypothetical protein VE547_14815 [Mycobacteriales bacterium]|nr:hypothetical protein [Mycobacteriales bacterium]
MTQGEPHPVASEATMDLTCCPACGVPAEITDRFVLESTAGPTEHAQVRCVARHCFLLPVRTLARRRLDRARRPT